MKFRGKKRYYRNLMNTEIPQLLESLNSEESWFDFYHQHIKNRDFENHSWKSRMQHLNALFNLAKKYEEFLSGINKEFQYWIYINETDCWDDAIYLHTQNPNGTEFPLTVENIEGLRGKNENLEIYLNEKKDDYKIVRISVFDENRKESVNYYLYKQNIGISLEK